MRRNGALPSALWADMEGKKAKNEEDGRVRKKSQICLQMETVEENRRRKYNTFKPPNSDDFQNAVDIGASFADCQPYRALEQR
jgi:hypothetical protein